MNKIMVIMLMIIWVAPEGSSCFQKRALNRILTGYVKIQHTVLLFNICSNRKWSFQLCTAYVCCIPSAALASNCSRFFPETVVINFVWIVYKIGLILYVNKLYALPNIPVYFLGSKVHPLNEQDTSYYIYISTSLLFKEISK
jgi:hypothetical protein